MATRTGALATALTAVLLTAAGCTGDDPPAGSDPTPTPAASPRTFVSSGCANEEAVAGDISMRLAPTIVHDVDGDGADERIAIHLDPGGKGGCLAFTVVEKGRDTYSAAVEPVADADPLTFGRIIGAAQVNGEAGVEVMVLVGAGASTQFAAVYTWGGRGLVPMEIEGGEGSFPFGGSTGHVDAVDCTRDRAVVSTSAVRSGGGFAVTRRFYAPARLRFELLRGRTERTKISEQELTRFPEFRAGPFAGCPLT